MKEQKQIEYIRKFDPDYEPTDNILNDVRETFKEMSYNNWLNNDKKGIVNACTGFGKTKIGLDIINYENPEKCLVIVPSSKLRDVEWPNEIKKWHPHLNIEIITHAKYKKDYIDYRDYDLLVIDEAHNMVSDKSTESLSRFNGNILLLSGSIGKKESDILNIPIISSISLEEAGELGIVVNIIQLYAGYDLTDSEKTTYQEQTSTMSNYLKNFKEWKINPFSYKKGKYIGAVINFKKVVYERKLLLWNAVNKILKLKEILEKEKDSKCIIFFELIETLEDVSKKLDIPHSKYHSKHKDMSEFINENNKVLLCTRSLEEGFNIPDIEVVINYSFNSSTISSIQKQGRAARLFQNKKEGRIYYLYANSTKESEWIPNKYTARQE